MKRVVVLTAVALIVGAVVAQAASASRQLELIYDNGIEFRPAANGEAVNLVTEGIKLSSANGTVTCGPAETEGKLKKNFQGTDKLEFTKGASAFFCRNEGWFESCVEVGGLCGNTSVSLFPKKVMTLGLGANEKLKTKNFPATFKGSPTYPAVVRLYQEEVMTSAFKVCEFTVSLKGSFGLSPVVPVFENGPVARLSPASEFCPAGANMSITFVPRTLNFQLYDAGSIPG